MTYVLRQRSPGGPYMVRGTHNGRRVEISTGHRVEAVAWAAAVEIWADVEGGADAMPEAMPLGPFERHLLESFRLDGEAVVEKSTGRTIPFSGCADGYRNGRVRWQGREKSVLEHRIKFLLHHRWLPRTVDHDNRKRDDNALANLKASTPRLQSANRGPVRKFIPGYGRGRQVNSSMIST